MPDLPPAPIAEAGPATPRHRGPLRMVAVLAATLLVAGAAAYLGTRDDGSGSSRPKLALRAASGGTNADAAIASEARSSLMINTNIHYVVEGSLPTMPTEARVYELAAPSVDAARVGEWAKVLHVDGTVDQQPGTGGVTTWQVTGSDGSLSVSGDPSMMYFTYQPGSVQPGSSEPGSGSGTASVSASGSAGIQAPGEPSAPDTPVCGSGTVTPDGTAISEPCGPPVDTPTTRPANLPSIPEARRIGEQVLRDLGVLDGDWAFEAFDGGSVSVSASCAVDTPCPPAVDDAYVVSRTVVAHRVVDGHRVDGVDWIVEVGDGGTITSVAGALGTPVSVADYPLISVDAARRNLADGPAPGAPIPAVGAPEPAIAESPCGPAVDCLGPTTSAPMPICPESCPVTDVTITITGVSMGIQLWTGGDVHTPTMYLVPTYHFTGHDASGTEWSTDVLALTADTLATKP